MGSMFSCRRANTIRFMVHARQAVAGSSERNGKDILQTSLRILFSLTLSLGLGACGSGRRSNRDWSTAPAVFTLTGVPEIYAMGDIHGDLDVALHVLAAAGLVDASSHWIGGNKTLVVTGDVIDKGMAALPVIDLLTSLQSEARAAGGNVVVTLGNHEAEFLANPTDDKSVEFQAELLAAGLKPVEVASGQGTYGAWFHTRPVAALIDGWFFCHAGNSDGESAASIAKKFQSRFEEPLAANGGLSGFGDSFLTGSKSLLEATLWWEKGASSVTTIDESLAALPAQHIVFGHDPGEIDFPDDPEGKRKAGKMVARYAARIFLIDVGMSYAIGYSDGSLLKIVRGTVDSAAIIERDGTNTPLWH